MHKMSDMMLLKYHCWRRGLRIRWWFCANWILSICLIVPAMHVAQASNQSISVYCSSSDALFAR